MLPSRRLSAGHSLFCFVSFCVLVWNGAAYISRSNFNQPTTFKCHAALVLPWCFSKKMTLFQCWPDATKAASCAGYLNRRYDFLIYIYMGAVLRCAVQCRPKLCRDAPAKLATAAPSLCYDTHPAGPIVFSFTLDHAASQHRLFMTLQLGGSVS